MWLKALGSMCIIFSTSGFGYFKGLEYKEQIEELGRMKKVIWQLRGEIKYTRRSLDEVCRKVSKMTETPYDKWLEKLSDSMLRRGSSSLGSLWKEETTGMVKTLKLREEEKRELVNLGYQLGHVDIAMQEQILKWYEEKLEEERKMLSKRIEEKRRLCNCLGVMSGVLFVILIW